MELDRSTTDKFDKVLNDVIDPQSELSLAELGLVKNSATTPPRRPSWFIWTFNNPWANV